MTDQRKEARIPTRRILRSLVVMFLCRLGSLNALGQTRTKSFWSRWLGGAMPSPDTLGRCAGLVDPAPLRELAHHLYDVMKRGKVLAAPEHGLMAGIVDGHETHASCRRHCDGCLERTLHTRTGDKVQYYHRLVAFSLVSRDLRLMLDAEPILTGEDEVAAAIRLLERVLKNYPRAFDVVLGDALYADSRFFNFLLGHGKHAMAVLKQEARDLYQDAEQVFEQVEPVEHLSRGRQCICQDAEGFRTWPQVQTPVRVVRSLETTHVRRQLDKQVESTTVQWEWVTTLPQARASTTAVVALGHCRWDIENDGFNEMVNQWKADHVYRHDPTAILVLWLLAMICLNVFTAFFRRNLKPALRAILSRLHVAREIAAELYAGPARSPI